MEKKQTAVEWFYQRILAKDIKEVFEQAKAMHKEEVKESYREGRTDQQSSSDSFYNRNAEQYYNQTFGGEQ
jgi:hypothetical protein